MNTLRLQLTPGARTTFAALNVLPLPGIGAILAGRRNPHTMLLRNGCFQLGLFVLGAYPLIIPGAIALVWAVVDAFRIAQADLVRLPPAEAQASA